MLGTQQRPQVSYPQEDIAWLEQQLATLQGGQAAPSPQMPRAAAPSMPEAMPDPVTLEAIEDLQNGRATPEMFYENEEALRASGVNTDLIRQLMGL